MNILDKITTLIGRYRTQKGDAQDIDALGSWYDQAKKLFLLKSLKDHDGMKYVLEAFQSDIEKIDGLLKGTYSKELSDKERDRLLDRKALAQKYVNLFLTVEDELEQLEEAVDREKI